MSKAYADLIPKGQLQLIEGGSNSLTEEMPEAIAQLIRNFVANC